MIKLNIFWTIIITLVFLGVGLFLVKMVAPLRRLCIPAPVIGGFIGSFVAWGLHSHGYDIRLNDTLQNPLMTLFFACIGLGASYKVVRAVGRSIVPYILICWGLGFTQNLLGAGLASLMGLSPALGVMAGSVSLEGGHAAAAVLGNMIAEKGVTLAPLFGISSATLGLIIGGMLGGPVASILIKRHKVPIEAKELDVQLEKLDHEYNIRGFLETLFWVVLVSVGSYYLHKLFKIGVPPYIIAMVISVLLRNLFDFSSLQILTINERVLESFISVTLGLFLTTAILVLKPWHLSSLAIPLLTILVVQVALVVFLAYFVIFRIMGRDYDAAIFSAGFVGHTLGATPNALLSMSTVCHRYNMYSKKAFLVIPVCGAILVDLVTIPYSTWLLQFLLK